MRIRLLNGSHTVYFWQSYEIKLSMQAEKMNNQVKNDSENPIRTHFTLGVDTEAYFGCSVVYHGETLVLGGKKEPNQVCLRFYLLKYIFFK